MEDFITGKLSPVRLLSLTTQLQNIPINYNHINQNQPYTYSRHAIVSGTPPLMNSDSVPSHDLPPFDDDGVDEHPAASTMNDDNIAGNNILLGDLFNKCFTMEVFAFYPNKAWL